MIGAALSWLAGTRLGRWTAIAVAVVAAALAARWALIREGASQERAKQQRETLNAVETRNRVESDAAREPDPARRLRDRWGR